MKSNTTGNNSVCRLPLVVQDDFVAYAAFSAYKILLYLDDDRNDASTNQALCKSLYVPHQHYKKGCYNN